MTARELGKRATSLTQLIRELDYLSQIRRELGSTGTGPHPVKAYVGNWLLARAHQTRTQPKPHKPPKARAETTLSPRIRASAHKEAVS